MQYGGNAEGSGRQVSSGMNGAGGGERRFTGPVGPGQRGPRVSGSLPVDPTAGEVPSRSRRSGPTLPGRPASLEETGLDVGLVQELIFKHLANAGQLSATAIAAQLRLPLSGVLDEVLNGLQPGDKVVTSSYENYNNMQELVIKK